MLCCVLSIDVFSRHYKKCDVYFSSMYAAFPKLSLSCVFSTIGQSSILVSVLCELDYIKLNYKKITLIILFDIINVVSSSKAK